MSQSLPIPQPSENQMVSGVISGVKWITVHSDDTNAAKPRVGVGKLLILSTIVEQNIGVYLYDGKINSC